VCGQSEQYLFKYNFYLLIINIHLERWLWLGRQATKIWFAWAASPTKKERRGQDHRLKYGI
jgi:hypothetical protein